ncbi:hypothetical protein [Actinokineospora fastidiosa]|uniref:hypothetical protein n=1 Tax=Actinokineospora fastidiosa TaxID=1816 RepID=UPI001E3B926A|nr:hypothetical protein [Actinokineospora fastidiosa]
MTGSRKGDEEERQVWAEELLRRLDRPMSMLGVLFLFVVLGQTLAIEPALNTVLVIVGWALWLVFVGEFALRLYVAPMRGLFLRRNWWQLVFLVVPFLRFLRVVRVLRIARAGGVLSSAVRGSRSAGRLLSGRLGWLMAVTGVLVLACSQLLMLTGDYQSYHLALHDVALATITGEPMTQGGGFARFLEVVLACYSVAVFAALAASLGAYFLRPDGPSGEIEKATE